MAKRLFALGAWCARRRWWIVAAWVLVAVVIGAGAVIAGQDTSDDLTLPGTDSQNATDLLDDRFPSQANGTVPVAIAAPAGEKLSRSEYERPIDQVTRSYSNDRAVRRATGPFDRGGELGAKGSTGIISLELVPGPSELTTGQAERLVDLADPLEDAGLRSGVGGYVGKKVSRPSTHLSEAVGIIAAAIILLLTFGTAVAMGVPLLTALIGLAIGLGSLTLLGHLAEVPSTAPALATMIGLGVGTDYALFMVTRYRALTAAGTERADAIARTTATSGNAIVFAGTTVIIALVALWAAQIPIVTMLGLSAAIVVAIAMVAAITLLPALLALLGGGIERLRLPGRLHHDGSGDRPHGWERWAIAVTARPWLAMVAGFAVLIALAIPVFSLTLGQQDDGAMPRSTESRKSYDLVRNGFGAGANGSILVSVDMRRKAHNDQASLNQLEEKEQRQRRQAEQREQAQVESLTGQLVAEGIPEDEASQQAQEQVSAQAPTQSTQQGQQLRRQKKFLRSTASDPRLVELGNRIEKTADVDSVSPAVVNGSGTAAVLTVVPTSAPSSPRTADLVTDLREDVLPKATAGKGETAYVGGSTASYIDLADQIASKLPLVIGLVLVLTFAVLLLAFRSVLVPLKAVVMNLLSILAAFGVVSYAFSHDWTARLVGLEGAVPIVSYVPLMMFAILFGLSMDYEVFLMTHIRERWLARGDAHDAVVHGLAITARVITSAALIMVSVFCAFVISGDPTIKQFGLGMAVAVAVDATVVRCLLVPAVLSVIGRGAWWMPGWLERHAPRISIEGDENLATARADG